MCCVSFAEKTTEAIKLVTESSGYYKRIPAMVVRVSPDSFDDRGTGSSGSNLIANEFEAFISRFHADQLLFIEDGQPNPLDHHLGQMEKDKVTGNHNFVFYRFLEYMSYKGEADREAALSTTLLKLLGRCRGTGNGGLCIFLETVPFSEKAALQTAMDALSKQAEVCVLDDVLEGGVGLDGITKLLENVLDLVPGSFPLAMPHATESNTSPLSALVRAYALSSAAPLDGTHSTIGTATATAATTTTSAIGDRRSLLRSLLCPIDEWFCSPDATLQSELLRKSLLVTSTGRKAERSKADELKLADVIDPLRAVGRSGRDTALDLTQDGGELEKVVGGMAGSNGSSSSSSSGAEGQSGSAGGSTRTIVACLLHERVARELDKRRSEIPYFIEKVVKEKIIHGDLQRNQNQCSFDVLTARLDKKVRVFYTQLNDTILILDVLWDHYYQKTEPILRTQRDLEELRNRAQHEMNILKNWQNLAQVQPYVVVDFMSGMLRPLFHLPLDSTRSEFKFNMMNMVLSPGQKDACALATLQACAGSTSAAAGDPIINIVVLQGSAGNGKTTCLLHGGLQRARGDENVVFVAATKLLADSIENDLKGSIVDTFRVMVKNGFKDVVNERIRRVAVLLADAKRGAVEMDAAVIQELGKLLEKASHEDLHPVDVNQWLAGRKKDDAERKNESLREWLMTGHRLALDTEKFVEYAEDYERWKEEFEKRDEGDMWALAAGLLVRVEEAMVTGENESSWGQVDAVIAKVERECDVLVIDEAQLYPAESVFRVLLQWYRPRRTLLLGMDTKQAVTLGCSKRDDLVAEVRRRRVWRVGTVEVKTLNTNFRLPARLVALSNAMVRILRQFYPKVFDEYQTDVGFEGRTAGGGETESVALNSAVASSGQSVSTIEKFPVMMILGDAAKEMRKRVVERLQANRRSVLALRFADLQSEAESQGGREVATNEKVDLDVLPTINFQAVSGLEVLQTVIVDRLLSTYINKVCARSIFSKVISKKEDANEHPMLRKALCLIYTVATRCRGPLIWLEDNESKDMEKCHPLIRELKKHLEGGKMNIQFVTDVKMINDDFINRIFDHAGADLEQINQAFEESTRQLLDKFKKSFWTCFHLLKAGGGVQVARDLEGSEEYRGLLNNKKALLNQLAASSVEGAADCSAFLDKLPATLLLRVAGMGSAPGTSFQWVSKWDDELRDLIAAVELFPSASRMALRDITQHSMDAALTSALPDRSSADGQPSLSIEQRLSRKLRICSCGTGPSLKELSFCFAFPGPESASVVWCVYKIERPLAIAAQRHCIVDGSYVLTCVRRSPSAHAKNCQDVDGLIMLKFADSAELTITRAASGFLMLQERCFVSGKGARGLLRSTSSCQGMKLRCEARGTVLGEFPRRHAYGPYVADVEGQLVGAEMKFRRCAGPIASVEGALCMPPVGNAQMISIVERLLMGDRLDVQKLTAPMSHLASVDPETLWTGPKPSVAAGAAGALCEDPKAVATFIWNNFFGGQLLLSSHGAAYQAWHIVANMLHPSSSGSSSAKAWPVHAVLEDVRRELEICLRLYSEHSDKKASIFVPAASIKSIK